MPNDFHYDVSLSHSAKTGEGCDQLREAIVQAID
jgi:hypothetical protein